MGIFSEVSASSEAKVLEIILWKAVNSGNEAIKSFAKTHIIPAYKDAKMSAFEALNDNLMRALEYVPTFTGVK